MYELTSVPDDACTSEDILDLVAAFHTVRARPQTAPGSPERAARVEAVLDALWPT